MTGTQRERIETETTQQQESIRPFEESGRTGASRYPDKAQAAGSATITDIRVRLRALAERARAEQALRAKAAQAAREDAQARDASREEKLQVLPVGTSRYEDKRQRMPQPETQSPQAAEAEAAPAVRHRARIWAAAAAAAVLLTGYGAAAAHFRTHFFPRTTSYGVDVSGMTLAEASEAVLRKADAYRLIIRERGGAQDQITADQIGLHVADTSALEAGLKDQHSLLWPVICLFGRGRSADVTLAYDREGVDDVLDTLPGFDPARISLPVDAALGETSYGYDIVPEEMGNTPDRALAAKEIRKALDRGDAIVNLELTGCYLEPEVYADDPQLLAQKEELNALFGASLSIDFGDREEIVDADVIRTMIGTKADGSYYIDPEQVRAYTDGLAAQYDTYGGYRTFHTSTGRTVELWGGDYGWEMDTFETTQRILDGIHAKSVGPLDPVYTHTALCRDANDLGGTYVEVSITDQEMWVYQDGQLMVDTPVVTGNPNKDNATPSGGVWEIDGKYRDEVLVGEGYRQPVDYWIPFNGGVGIHDLKSRYYYGGTIYLTNGSHGCVNTPLDAVTEIYDIVYAGVPVVVYE